MHLKRVQEFDQEYLRFIKGWPCCVPHCGHWPVDCHHVITRGRGGSDLTCIPLCHNHHLRGVHQKGKKTCQKEWGVNFDKLIEEFNRRYRSQEYGPNHRKVSLAELLVAY